MGRPHQVRHNRAQPGSKYKRRLRIFVFIRDEGICQLCGEPVPFTEMALDRKIPGGRYNRENTQAAHEPCNKRKGNRELPRFAFRAEIPENT